MPAKFSYFPVMAKGLAPLLALEEHQVAYDGNKVGVEAWPAMKATGVCPFGQLPILETEDVGVIAQSQAIVQYVARSKNADGKDIKERVRNEMVIGLSEDFYTATQKHSPTPFVQEPCPKEETVKFWAETVPARLAHAEKFIDGKDRFTEAGNSTGELHFFATLHQMKLVQGDFLDKTPNVLAFYNRVHALPSVQKVLKGETSFGELIQYFLKRE
eukprot:TRINITY_DN1018_c0_g1_i1.p1 TRINITY_DN1018_c0_g1~~TRINITY_DN1018_c0_g1_i1.p1  ORF type:complete len:215 (+),score=110.64 TRINITY_DN1018_c0_g1_i1:57-701(+)